MPYSALTATGDDFEDAQRKMDAMQAQQNQLLAQLRQQLATLPPPDLSPPSDRTDSQAEEDKRRQLVQLLAEIEKRVNEENARPKKRYISPATREAVYAGESGQQVYKELFSEARKVLRAQGKLVVELGEGAGREVCRLAQEKGWVLQDTQRDLAQINRCAIFGRSAEEKP